MSAAICRDPGCYAGASDHIHVDVSAANALGHEFVVANLPCPPDCSCEGCEEREISATRDLAIEAPDWYRLGAAVGVDPKDMSLFIMSDISLTAPARERIRKHLAKAEADPIVTEYVIPSTTLPARAEAASVAVIPAVSELLELSTPTLVAPITMQLDAPPCSTCGDLMVRNGSCYRCFTCGTTSGCS